MISQAQNVKIEIITEPKAAAFCPLGEYPPLIPCLHGCKVVMSFTLLSKHPISLANVSDAATATAALNNHNPLLQSSLIKA